MKYETPQLTALSSAINAIETVAGGTAKVQPSNIDSGHTNEVLFAYEDWE